MNILNSLKVKNKPSRNAFDMQERVSLSGCSGALLPISHMHLSPGDKVKGNISFFDRTEGLATAPFAAISESVDVFFVPYRIIWQQSDAFFTKMSAAAAANVMSSVELDVTNVPAFTPETVVFVLTSIEQERGNYLAALANRDTDNPSLSFYGLDRGYDMERLLQYLGYGDFVKSDHCSPVARENKPLNALPLLAYHKIYNDFYRNTQWEKEQPHLWYVNDVDNSYPLTINVPSSNYVNQPHIFDLQFCNYEKDKFSGLLPHSQFGQPSVVNTSSSLISSVNGRPLGITAEGIGVTSSSVNGSGQATITPTTSAYLNNAFNFSVLAYRQASALQKWQEIAQFTSTDYKHQVKAHWDIDVSDARSNLCTWITGKSSLLDINPIINQNLNLEDDEPTTKATATNNAGCFVDFTAPEHGIFMVLYHNKPLIQYDGRYTPIAEVNKIHNADFPIPEFDSIGMEGVDHYNMDIRLRNPQYEDAGNMGYAPRYIDFKSRIDRCLGNMNGVNKFMTLQLPERIMAGSLYIGASAGGNPVNNLQLSYCRWKVAPNDVGNIFFSTKSQTHVEESDRTTFTVGINGYGSDQFNLDFTLSLTKVSNLNYSGMPY